MILFACSSENQEEPIEEPIIDSVQVEETQSDSIEIEAIPDLDTISESHSVRTDSGLVKEHWDDFMLPRYINGELLDIQDHYDYIVYQFKTEDGFMDFHLQNDDFLKQGEHYDLVSDEYENFNLIGTTLSEEAEAAKAALEAEADNIRS